MIDTLKAVSYYERMEYKVTYLVTVEERYLPGNEGYEDLPPSATPYEKAKFDALAVRKGWMSPADLLFDVLDMQVYSVIESD